VAFGGMAAPAEGEGAGQRADSDYRSSAAHRLIFRWVEGG
jgi:hypothetical protein